MAGKAKLQPPRGTHDMMPEAMRLHRHVADTARDVCLRYGFEEIATPVFESTELFARGIGEATDVVSKEMYTFTAREGGDALTLRPENTAGVARAFLSNGLTQSVPVRHFYAGPMFRYERPQKGRQRQFHQIGAELIGSDKPLADIEVIASGAAVLRELGLLERTTLKLNSLGDTVSRTAFRTALVEFFSDHLADLTEESQKRLEKNPLRILDSKSESDQAIAAGAPRFADYLNEESRDFYAAVRDGLDQLGIAYETDDRLVRGLDYYCHTAFEFVTSELGAQSGVLGGGRYDGLIEQIGGPATPGVGWAAGMERIELLIGKSPAATVPVALVPMGPAAEARAITLAEELRWSGIRVDVAHSGNAGKRMKRADKLGAAVAVVFGDDELAQNAVQVKTLATGDQQTVALDQLAAALSPQAGEA